MSAHYREVSRQDWVETVTYLLLWLLVTGLGGFVLLPAYGLIWVLLMGGMLWWLVHWHVRNFAYRCPHCGHEFEISDWVNFISPQGLSRQGGGRKYLKCPNCHVRTWASILRIRLR